MHLPMESVHPLIVHFPIALLLTAFWLDVAAVVLRRDTLHRVSFWNLALGVLGAGAAVLSGLRAEEIAKHSFEIHEVIELHERMGIITLILGLMWLGWRIMKRDRLGPAARLASLALGAAMVSTLTVGAYLGGRLVYEFGVGGTFGQPANTSNP